MDSAQLQTAHVPNYTTTSYVPLCFNPKASPLFRDFNFDLEQPPRYLFRTFDHKSSGHSDDHIIMSPAAVRNLPHHSVDIFSLDPDFAMAVLEKHMNPWRRKHLIVPEPEPNIDNFMSWTTSLLYAVQYAYHRRRLYGCSSDKIMICAVDVTLFPPGQFIRASALLQAHFDMVKQDDMRHHIGVRLLAYIYTFGEYLSQGTLMHRRPCEKMVGSISHVISLASLQNSGLPVLYPELDDPIGHDKWALRTIYLRKIWHRDEYGNVNSWRSSREELEAAVRVAMTWFKHPFDPLHLAICLLSFKRRDISTVNLRDAPGGLSEEWMRHPIDVREFASRVGFIDGAIIDSPIDESFDRSFKSMQSSRCFDKQIMLHTLLSSYICDDTLDRM